MTAQFSDIVKYKGIDYRIGGVDGEGLFDPSRYGMKPVAWCSACWHGCNACYEVENQKLYLSRLKVCLTDISMGLKKVRKKRAPVIEGHKATDISHKEHDLFEYSYDNMRLLVPFTGGLLLGTDFIEHLHMHAGIQPAWKYRTVHELLFDKGHLTKASDVSQKIAVFRSKMKNPKMGPWGVASDEELRAWIRGCLSKDYNL